MKHLFSLLALACFAFFPPTQAIAQSTTKAVTKASVSSSNQYLIQASEVKVNGPIYAESAVVVDSGQAIKFKISATGAVTSSAPVIRSGEGSPNGVITAPKGSIWLRTDGGADSSVYFKESGTGSSGWIGK